jgi:serine/threonine protein kinase
VSRHSTGVYYSPPTTPGYSAPEVARQVPDPRSDVFSLGAVLYTMIAGYQWTWNAEAGACVEADSELDKELKDCCSRRSPRSRQALPDDRGISHRDRGLPRTYLARAILVATPEHHLK